MQPQQQQQQRVIIPKQQEYQEPREILLDAETGEVLEVAVHKPGPLIVRDLTYFLNACIAEKRGPREANCSQVLVLTTCQKSRVDLANWDVDASNEKDRLLGVFVDFAQTVCIQLRTQGYWADFTDPASGLLVLSPGQRVWPEIQSLQRLRGFRLGQAGGCHILLHPKWGGRMYPASIFTDAPLDLVHEALFSGPELTNYHSVQ